MKKTIKNPTKKIKDDRISFISSSLGHILKINLQPGASMLKKFRVKRCVRKAIEAALNLGGTKS